jgi:glycosyltransferase involved in cell wall biosynthesis
VGKTDPLVSVVTPAYNAEEYLRECIESVVAQTYTSWDYTIVDNCSTDGTLEIAKEFAAKDPRIRVHSNETFVRAIANHNIALRRISRESKYCKVLSADDWLFPECLEKMVRLAEEHPNVVAVNAYGLFGTEVVHDGVIPATQTVVQGREACRSRLLGGKWIFGSPTSVLFRADAVRIRPCFYNESNLHADSEVNFELLEHQDLGFVHQVLTFHRERESLSSFSRSFETYLPARLYELVTYGPRYLSDAEQRLRLKETLRDYYRYLAIQLYEGRGPQFWKFHRDKLAEVGFALSRRRLAASAALFTLELLLNPLTTVRRFARRVRRTWARTLSPGR